MPDQKIYTVEEVAGYLRVPPEAIEQEVRSGRLRTFLVGSFVRIREQDLNHFLNLSADRAQKAADTLLETWLRLAPGKPFEYRWPSGDRENYEDVMEGVATYGGRERRVKLGFTKRHTAGRNRARCLVLIDKYATVEFVGADDFQDSKVMVSVLKDPSGKQVPVGGRIPPDYADFELAPYRKYVTGPSASTNLAIVARSDEFDAMVQHALIRADYNERARATRAGAASA